MTKLRCAVIGVGYLGRFHAQKYAQIASVDLVGVYDLSTEQAQLVAHELNVQCFIDLHQLLDKVDAVSIAASTVAHYDIAKLCIQKGVHVLIEKPITLHFQEGQELVQLAKEKQVVLQVGHLERFNPAYQTFQHHLQQPLWIEMQRLAPFKKRGSDADVILDLMIHDLDILLSWIDSPVADIQAQGFSMMTSAVDLATVVIKFKNACVANLTASRVHSKVERITRVYQEQDYFVLNYQEQQLTRYIAKPMAHDHSFLSEEAIPCQKHDALYAQVESFIEAIHGRGSIMVDGESGLKALELALNIQSMIRSHVKEVHFV